MLGHRSVGGKHKLTVGSLAWDFRLLEPGQHRRALGSPTTYAPRCKCGGGLDYLVDLDGDVSWSDCRRHLTTSMGPVEL